MIDQRDIEYLSIKIELFKKVKSPGTCFLYPSLIISGFS